MIYVPIKIIVVSIVILVLPEGRWSIFMVDLIKNYIDLQGYDGNIMGYNDLYHLVVWHTVPIEHVP
jgi:hypothetical protein